MRMAVEETKSGPCPTRGDNKLGKERNYFFAQQFSGRKTRPVVFKTPPGQLGSPHATSA